MKENRNNDMHDIPIYSFSIVLCTYNRASSLVKTLKSLNNLEIPQGHDAELIIVNNNSKDSTREICDEYVKSSAINSKWFLEENQGLSYARNRGVTESTGSIVIFTDDDVTVPVNWLLKYRDSFMETSADAVFGRITPEWGVGRPAWYHERFSAIYGQLDYGPTRLIVETNKYEFFGANFACNRELLVSLGGFDPKLGRTPDSLYISEERKIFLSLLERKRLIVYDPEIHVYHHISPNMKTREYIKKYYEDTAISLVNITKVNQNRQLLGVPYYRWIEVAQKTILFLPLAGWLLLTGNGKGLFPLRLELRRLLRIVRLHITYRNRRKQNY